MEYRDIVMLIKYKSDVSNRTNINNMLIKIMIVKVVKGSITMLKVASPCI